MRLTAAWASSHFRSSSRSQILTPHSGQTRAGCTFTPLVQQWVADPASNQGLILRLGGTEKFTTYRLRSGDYWFAEFGPHVQVTYREP